MSVIALALCSHLITEKTATHSNLRSYDVTFLILNNAMLDLMYRFLGYCRRLRKVKRCYISCNNLPYREPRALFFSQSLERV